MKSFLLIFCLVLISFAAFGQIPGFGIKGGVNFAGQTISNDGTNISSNTLTTFNAGVFADFKFGLISLQPALNFTGKGGKYTDEATNNNAVAIGSATVTEKLYYLQLPVNIVFHVPILIGNIYFGAGPYIAEGLSGKVTSPAPDGSGTSANESVHFGSSEGDISATQFGVDAIAGIKFANGFLININYDLGLTNDDPYSGDNLKAKSHVFGVSVGYVFL